MHKQTISLDKLNPAIPLAFLQVTHAERTEELMTCATHCRKTSGAEALAIFCEHVQQSEKANTCSDLEVRLN
jgi:hypothetical protein